MILLALAGSCLSASGAMSRVPANGAELAEVCRSDQRSISRQCDLLILSVVFEVVTGARHHNPFNACPIALNPADALQERLDGLRVAVTGWLETHPDTYEEKDVQSLVRQAVLETDVCAYR